MRFVAPESEIQEHCSQIVGLLRKNNVDDAMEYLERLSTPGLQEVILDRIAGTLGIPPKDFFEDSK